MPEDKNQQLNHQLNDLLERYYDESIEEPQRLRTEHELLEASRPWVRRCLRGYSNLQPADIEDLGQYVLSRFWKVLRQSRQGQCKRIENLASYLRKAAKNQIIEKARKGCARTILLSSLEYLTRPECKSQTFARWKRLQQWLFGFRVWENKDFVQTRNYNRFCSDADCCRSEWKEQQDQPFPEFLVPLFKWLETPMKENELADQLLKILPPLLGYAELIDDTVEIWAEEIEHKLPIYLDSTQVPADWQTYLDWLAKQSLATKCVLLLNRDHEDLTIQFGYPNPIPYLAELLGMSQEEMRNLWLQLPLSDEKIAERLNTTKGRVQTLRSNQLKSFRESENFL